MKEFFIKFSTGRILKIINKYKLSSDFAYNTERNRKILIDELNNTFFPDYIAKFIDKTIDYSDHLSLMIEYKDIQYNILAYKTDIRKKVDRIRKLKQLNENL